MIYEYGYVGRPYVGEWVYVSTIKTKTPDRNDVKICTVVVLDTLSKPIDLGFKRSRVKVKVRVMVRVWKSASICISVECAVLLVR